MSIFSDVAGWIEGWHLERFLKKLHDNSASLWTKISPTVQDIIKASSTIVHLLQLGSNFPVPFIKDKLYETLPFLNDQKLTDLLKKAGIVINIASDIQNDSLDTMLSNIQKHMASMDSVDAKQYAEDLANWLAYWSTPEDTTFSVISNTMKFAFQTFVKNKYDNIFQAAA